jgi:hypothetical protein
MLFVVTLLCSRLTHLAPKKPELDLNADQVSLFVCVFVDSLFQKQTEPGTLKTNR